ncbi:hypothetical protein BDV19DRAFT_7468 [Aspergillus venezuelensis]
MPHSQQPRPTSTCLPASVIIPLPHTHLISPTYVISVTISSNYQFHPSQTDGSVLSAISCSIPLQERFYLFSMHQCLSSGCCRFLSVCHGLVSRPSRRFAFLCALLGSVVHLPLSTKDTILYILLYTPICTEIREKISKYRIMILPLRVPTYRPTCYLGPIATHERHLS